MSSAPVRRTGLAALATSLVIGGAVAGAGSAMADQHSFDLDRIAGDNRYSTSAKAADAFGAADTVIVASGEPGRYPDALTANYLAGLRDAPVVLTRKDRTPADVAEAIRNTGAQNVIIVGGETAVSAEQEQQLSDDYTVSRLSGDDRFGTAAAVIDEGGNAGTDTALLATGMNFPDALGGGPASFAEGMPLAITRVNDMPDNVLTELKQAGISKVLVLGGESAVSQAVVDELEDAEITVEKRFDGEDRAETSTLLADHAIAEWGFSDSAVNVASGYVSGDGADALGGAALTGQQERALLITKSDDTAGEAVLGFLGTHGDTLTEGTIFGGEAALTADVETDMEKAAMGSGAQNAESGALYDDVQAAIEDAEEGDTITVFGTENAGFSVDKDDLTIQGEPGAAVNEAIQIDGVDGVTITGLTITPSSVANTVAGVYLNDAEDIVITKNTFTGEDKTGAGVINVTGGAEEVAEISGNTFRGLMQGVFANPSAEFTITDNVFRSNIAASANDAPSTITDNRFIDNGEGIGVSVEGATIEENFFDGNEDAHVRDYTGDEDAYDLDNVIVINDFADEVMVTEDGNAIVDDES